MGWEWEVMYRLETMGFGDSSLALQLFISWKFFSVLLASETALHDMNDYRSCMQLPYMYVSFGRGSRIVPDPYARRDDLLWHCLVILQQAPILNRIRGPILWYVRASKIPHARTTILRSRSRSRRILHSAICGSCNASVHGAS